MSYKFTIQKRYYLDLLILALTLVLITFGIGTYGLYEPHEGHFTMVGQEMLLRGDWLTPHLNGDRYLNKPPLLYWLIALSTSILGATEFAARLPLALAGWVGIIIVWKWSKELFGLRASRIAALMLSVSLGWFIFTHQLLTDVLLSTLILASNYFFWKLLSQPRSCLYFYSLYVSLSLCILTKGLIGVVLPLLNCLGLSIIKQDEKIWRKIKLGKGIMIILAIIAPWFVAVDAANPGFLSYFIVNEHIRRFFDVRFPPDYDVYKTSALGFVVITLVWSLPWSLFLPQIVLSTKRYWQKIKAKHRQDGVLLVAIAALTPILFFLPLSSRLVYYSLPAIPFYIILCAGWYSRTYLCSSPTSVHILGSIFVVIGLHLLSTMLFLPDLVNSLTDIDDKIDITQPIIILAFILGIGLLWAGIAMGQNRLKLSLTALWLSFAMTCMTITLGFNIYQYARSSKIMVNTIDSCLGVDALWIFEGSREIGAAGAMSYYLNQKKDYSRSTVFFTQDEDNRTLPLGWAQGEQDTIYRTVLILADGGKNRLPPQFPGATLSYLITQEKFRGYWYGDRPVVFVTDFLRNHDDPDDPPNLNLPHDVDRPLLAIANRKVYGNSAAIDRCYFQDLNTTNNKLIQRKTF
ncbi:MAG: ArnT family glycosyltransferase [Xenococcaceae cyanobacterium]